MSRSVITIATAKSIYLDMAINLARSFLRWNDLSRISFHIVTDLETGLPPDLRGVDLIKIAPQSLGLGFAPKLHLDRLAPTEKTLFIDADCLSVGALDSVFDRFSGQAVSVLGGTISEGEWFGDVAKICAHFSIPALPKFNGGIYYLERGQKASAVYQRARNLEKHYDEFGLVRLRNRPNDELLMAIAMALEGCAGIPDDGTIMGDLQSYPELVVLDSLIGQSLLRNPPPPDPRHQHWCSLQEVHPIIVHFLGAHAQGWRYRAEALKLYLVARLRFPRPLARFIGSTFVAPCRITEMLKEHFRPTFHRYFGLRKIQPGIR